MVEYQADGERFGHELEYVGILPFPFLLAQPLALLHSATDIQSDDHPHGGGRGKSKGNKNPVSPWGQPSKGGFKTRKRSNVNKWVVTARVRNMGKRRDKTSA